MSSKGLASLSGGGIKWDSFISETSERLDSCSEFLSRCKDWKRENARKEDVRNELKSICEAVIKQEKDFEALLAAQNEFIELLERISDEELIEKFRKILELLGYYNKDLLFPVFKEPRSLLRLEAYRLHKDTLLCYREVGEKFKEKATRLVEEFEAIKDKLEKDGEVLNELATSLQRSVLPLTKQGKCEDKATILKKRKLEQQRKSLKMEIESGSFDLNRWIVNFLEKGGMIGWYSEMKYKIESTCWGRCVPRWELSQKRKKRRDEREAFVKGYDVPSDEYCGNCFKAHIFNVLRLDDLVELIISINF